jgi:hypothetical protein
VIGLGFVWGYIYKPEIGETEFEDKQRSDDKKDGRD